MPPALAGLTGIKDRPFQLAGLAVVGLAVAASLTVVPGSNGLFGAGLAVLMTWIAAVDARSYTIPDELTAAAFGLALLQAALHDGTAVTAAVAAAALRGAIVAASFWLLRIVYRLLRHRDGLGLGDVKLAGVAGAWLSWTAIPVAVEIAACSAILIYVARQFRRGYAVRATARLPFGAFFAPAIWLGWVFEIVILGKL